MNKGLPEILYKYRSWQENEKIQEDRKFQKRFLTEKEIFFASSLVLNDPFELKIPKRYDLLTEDEILNLACYHIIISEPNLTGEEIVKKAVEAKSRMDYDKQLQATLDSLKSLKGRHGILSLTLEPMNIIMWTHYANNHQGFCIGYNTDKLMQFISTQTDKFGISPVTYTAQLPVIIPTIRAKSRLDNIISRVTTKSIEWSYEKEFRIVISEPNKVMQIPSDIVEEIILGCNVSKEVEKEIKGIKERNFPHSKIIKLDTDSYEYKLTSN